jgi:hypothetical protein
MNALLAAYALLLRLYPRRFRETFAGEMRHVYAQSLRDARDAGRGSLAAFALREFLDLPASLTREHWYAIRAGNAGWSHLLQGAGGSADLSSGGGPPPRAWEVILAGLPYVLFGLLMSTGPLTSALFGPEAALQSQNWLMIIIALPALAAIPLSIWKHRQNWSASWYLPYFLLALLCANLIYQGSNLDPQEFVASMLVLALAFVLYYAARAGAIYGLLAALPFSMLVWQPFLESTPRTIIDPFLQGMLTLTSWVLLGLVAALAAQTRRVGLALILALAVLGISGMGYAVLGTYQGGMLPFSEPGPSPRVAALYALRTLLISAAMLLGPQLARGLRRIGQRAGRLGGVSYRLALLGMVFIIAAFLLNSNQAFYAASSSLRFTFLPPLHSLLYVGLALYTGGYLLLLAAAWRANQGGDWLALALLYGLIAGVPLALFLGWPMRINAPALRLGQLAPAGLAWMLLSTGLVARFDARAGPRRA